MSDSVCLKGAISSCPNDTYIFEAWALKKIPVTLSLDLCFHDVQTLNALALDRAPFDLTKLSSACAGKVLDKYIILPVGAAFAMKAGPFLVVRAGKSHIRRVAIPGIHTSALLAFKMLYGACFEMMEMPFYQVPFAISSGLCDAGILIHEVQSNVKSYNFEILDDLGTSFREKFSFPLPLGVIAMKRCFGKGILDSATSHLSASIHHADKISPFVLEKAQDPALALQHIEAFVTKETKMMGKEEVSYLRSFFSLALPGEDFPEEIVHGV